MFSDFPHLWKDCAVMGERSVGQWIAGVMSFQKMYGPFGLRHHIVEISVDVTDAGQ